MGDRTANGFTLVELLVALIIFAFIVALSFDALRFSGAAWENVSTEAVAMDEEQSVLRFLRGRLESISVPHQAMGDDGESSRWWIRGAPDEVEFVAAWYRGAVPAGLYVFRLWKENGANTGTLNLSWRPLLPGAAEDARDALSGERILADGIAALAVRYHGSPNADGPSRWHRSWPDDGPAPGLVEIVITSEQTGQNWTRLVVGTRH